MAKIINKSIDAFNNFSDLEIGAIFEFSGNFFIKAYDNLNGETFGINLFSGYRREFSSNKKVISRLESEIIIK